MAAKKKVTNNNTYFLKVCQVSAVLCSLAVFGYWYIHVPGIVSKTKEEYDIIIVGAGPAGCVLANRLSQRKDLTVLLIEAGGEEAWFSSIPVVSPYLQQSSSDWNYVTEPQNNSQFGMRNRRAFWPRGKMLGGSMQLNYLLHMDGSIYDFERLEENGLPEWNFNVFSRYSRKARCLRSKVTDTCSMENESNGCEEDGNKEEKTCKSPPYRVKYVTPNEVPLAQAYLDAAKEIGMQYKTSGDKKRHGVSVAAETVDKGGRWSVTNGYLRPALGRPNLEVLLNAIVSKILWRGRKAHGLEYLLQGKINLRRTVYAKKQIILSAGTIGSAQILQLSGIGPESLLKSLGIPVVTNLPVGENLQDHLIYPVYHSIETKESFNIANILTLKSIWNYLVLGKGPITSNLVAGYGIFPLPSRGTPSPKMNPEIMVVLLGMGSIERSICQGMANFKHEAFSQVFPDIDKRDKEGFTFLSVCLHPKSRGYIRIKSNNPLVHPIIEPNYFSHPDDVNCTVEAMKLSHKLGRTKAFKKMGAKLHNPSYKRCDKFDRKTQNDLYLACIARIVSFTMYHPLGTCKMGLETDPTAVVTPDLRVKGVDGLMVVDASVFPNQISGTPTAAIIALAERASDIIIKKFKPTHPP